jgi:hypothetical protein
MAPAPPAPPRPLELVDVLLVDVPDELAPPIPLLVDVAPPAPAPPPLEVLVVAPPMPPPDVLVEVLVDAVPVLLVPLLDELLGLTEPESPQANPSVTATAARPSPRNLIASAYQAARADASTR